MTKKQMYSNTINICDWPKWMEREEINAIMEAAKAGDNTERDIFILAAMVYLGVNIEKAVNIQFCTACGDAIEDIKRQAFLHIPNEYRYIISEAIEKKRKIKLYERLTNSTVEEAEEGIKMIFSRAGISTDHYLMRLSRTAARLHYVNRWTNEENIKAWFEEIDYIEEKIKELFYKTMTADEIILNMPDDV